MKSQQPQQNHLNVYKGPDSLKNYFDPDVAPPLPLVELPDALNPYRKDGVHIYAKMMTMHPANNVKAMPAMNLLQKGVEPGKTSRIVEYSSGSTVISMALVSKVLYDLGDVHAYLSNKTATAKLKLMQFFGLNITLFGGPSQPEPLDERGGIYAADRAASEDESVVNPNQYHNDDNWKSHIRWTGPQILRQLPEINVICSGMGTSGTMSGLGTFFKQEKPSVYRLGVCTAAGDRVPGPRSLALMRPVEFPWKESVDRIEEVGSHESYSLSLQLCRNGIVCGPSSGFNLQGLYQFIEARKKEGTLEELANENGDGQIHCVTLCCDLPYQYINEYFDKLEPEHFPAMRNESLTEVDLYRYDEAWEKSPLVALSEFYRLLSNHHQPTSSSSNIARDILLYLSSRHPSDRVGWESIVDPEPSTAILDLRHPSDFESFSLPGSFNIPCESLLSPSSSSSSSPRPFSDPDLLSRLWSELDGKVKDDNESGHFGAILQRGGKKQRILVVCYNGDSARVATSVLRGNGYVADSIRGGTEALLGLLGGVLGSGSRREERQEGDVKMRTQTTTSMVDSVSA